MIFVTVGTHEQQFDRLVKKIDELKGEGIIRERVVVQTGFSNYEPVHCEWRKWFEQREMNELIGSARIVVTHGGPASFLAPIQMGRTPVVVPRQKAFGEHVNDHQLHFARSLRDRKARLILVEDIEELGDVLLHYEQYGKEDENSSYQSNNSIFNRRLEEMTMRMFA